MRGAAHRRVLLKACAIAAGAFVALGCRQIFGVDGYGTMQPVKESGDAQPGAICDRLEYRSESCQSCMNRECCREASDCAGDPSCNALAGCLANCSASDVDCRVTCNLSIRRTTEMSRLMECAASKNCDACAAARVTVGGVECTKCLEAVAPGELAAAARSFDALELQACQEDCSAGFEKECTCTPYAGGEGALVKLLNHSVCATACSTPDWSCLRNVQWPPLKKNPPPLDLEVSLSPVQQATADPSTTADSGTPADSRNHARGVEVKVCIAFDPACDAPMGLTGRTDEATGVVNFVVPPPVSQSYINYFDRLKVSWKETTEPSSVLLFLYPPLRRSPSWTWRRLVSREFANNTVARSGLPALDWENKGGIVFSAAACNGVPAPGVSATIKSGEQVFYLTEGLVLSKELHETQMNSFGALLNVDKGPKTLELHRASDGAKIGSYDFTVEIGATTTLALTPSPP